MARDGTLLLNASASADPDDPQGLGQKRLVFAWSCKGGAKGAPPAAAACAPLGKLPAANTWDAKYGGSVNETTRLEQ